MRRLFPPDAEQRIFDVDETYTIPELGFPVEGVPLSQGLRRPYIYFNMVSSVDGKATTIAHNATGLGSPVDYHLMGRLRLAADAIVVGGETFRRDPFVPNTRVALLEERLRYFPELPHPLGITLSRNGNLPLDKKFFAADPSRRVIFLSKEAPSEQVALLAKRARVFQLEKTAEGQTDLHQMLSIIYEELGVRVLLCEGGSRLNYALLSKGFGDAFFWTLAPKVVGGRENAAIVNGPGLGLPLDKLVRLHLRTIYEKDNELFMRYQIEH
ncbi:MAG: RibD family protein [Chloroflexota bacterium]|nr:RibD family protein [Chloroflexota bacterium]